jgi:hypothetical protein
VPLWFPDFIQNDDIDVSDCARATTKAFALDQLPNSKSSQGMALAADATVKLAIGF